MRRELEATREIPESPRQHLPRRGVVSSGQETADEGPRQHVDHSASVPTSASVVVGVAARDIRDDLLEAVEFFVGVRQEARGEVLAKPRGGQAGDLWAVSWCGYSGAGAGARAAR